MLLEVISSTKSKEDESEASDGISDYFLVSFTKLMIQIKVEFESIDLISLDPAKPDKIKMTVIDNSIFKSVDGNVPV